jgi:hypothetical protein
MRGTRTPGERAYVENLGRQVRHIKERRRIPYSQVAKECKVPLGRISGLVNTFVLVKSEHSKIQDWVDRYILHD